MIIDNSDPANPITIYSGYSPIYYTGTPDPNVGSNATYQTLHDMRQAMVAHTRFLSDGTFLTYYRKTAWMGNYPNIFDIQSDGSDFFDRMEGLAEKPSSTAPKQRIIPLHSAEDLNCSNALPPQEWLGPWLGGNNRFNTAEYLYADEYRNEFVPTLNGLNPGWSSEIKHIATGWYQYSCIKSLSTFTATNSSDPFYQDPHGTVGCNWYSPTFSVREINEEALLSLYPNPVKNNLFIELDETLVKNILGLRIINMQGQEQSVTYTIEENLITLNTTDLVKGFYIIEITDTESSYNEIIVK